MPHAAQSKFLCGPVWVFGVVKVLLRSEILSGMCAMLRTVAASNNRDHALQSLLLLLAHATHIYFFLRTHPVHGESHNQRNAMHFVLQAWCK